MEPLPLFITDNHSDDASGNVVSLPKLRQSIQSDRYLELKRELEPLDGTTPTGLPLLDVLWKHISLDGNGSLLEMVLLYELIVERVRESDSETIIADVSELRYRAVLDDVESACDVNVKYITEENRLEWFKRYGKELYSTVLFISNQLMLMLLQLTPFVRQPGEVTTLVFPFPGRESSVRSVVDQLKESHLVVVRSLFNFGSNVDEWGENGATSLSSFATWHTIRDELIFISRFMKDLLYSHNIERSVRATLRDATGHNLRHSTRHAVRTGCWGNINNLAFAIAAGNAFEQTDCEQVVVGSNSPRDRAIVAIATYKEIDTYQVPHTVVVPKERKQPRDSETTLFVPGGFDATYLEDNFSAERLPTLVPTGRPYLDHTIPETLDGEGGECDESLRLMIATQDKTDMIRRQFLTAMLDVTDLVPFGDVEVVVKIHPSESVKYYERLLDEYDGSTDGVSIASGSLWSHVDWADVVLTINSNVGLEAMYAGKPCICVNYWKPFTPDFAWATSDSVPVLETRDEFRNYMNALDRKAIEELAITQSDFVDNAYRHPWDSANAIARYIEDENPPVA